MGQRKTRKATKPKHRSFDPEYRVKALKLADSIGVTAAASQLGIQTSQIYSWRTKARGAATIPYKSDTYLGHVVVFISINFLNFCFKTAVFWRFLQFFASFGLIGTLFGRNHHFQPISGVTYCGSNSRYRLSKTGQRTQLN